MATKKQPSEIAKLANSIKIETAPPELIRTTRGKTSVYQPVFDIMLKMTPGQMFKFGQYNTDTKNEAQSVVQTFRERYKERLMEKKATFSTRKVGQSEESLLYIICLPQTEKPK